MRSLSLLLIVGIVLLVTSGVVSSKRTKPVATRNVSSVVYDETASDVDPTNPPAGVSPFQLPDGCVGTTVSLSSFRTYGHCDYMTGEALEGGVWTFDHGDLNPFEGWRSYDLTTNDFTAFRHITSTIWSGHGNIPSAPIINDFGSVWMGYFEDEADDACWKAGLGYGNDWRQRLTSPTFFNASDSVNVHFDYFYNTENTYDYVRVILDSGTSLDTLAEYTGIGGSYTSPLAFNMDIGVTGDFNILFEFESDGGYSDEDSLYATTLGAFGVDDIYVDGLEAVAGPWPPYGFELGLEGWTAEAFPGVGSQADVNNVAAYAIADPSCRLDGNVVTFHDEFQKHPAGQYERFISNRVDISSYDADTLSIFAQYDLYTDLPLAGAVSWTWGFVYYPYICPVTGDSIWSPPAGPPFFFYQSTPVCETIRSFANSTISAGKYSSGTILVPVYSDSIRFFVDIRCDSVAAAGNASPILDNVFIGVGSTSIIYVPSPGYFTIQSGINAASSGDTVLVAPGMYVGDSNRNLNFGGNDIVLMSERGPSETIINCMKSGRGFLFESGETDAAIVDGFTIIRGNPNMDGSAILVGPTASSPTFLNCRILRNSTINDDSGVIRVENGAPTFDCCTVALDTTVSDGVLIAAGGSPSFDNCNIVHNQASDECIGLTGGTPAFTNCLVDSNEAPVAVRISTASTFTTSTVSNNTGVGMQFDLASPSAVDMCDIKRNAGTGIVMGPNSSIFNACNIYRNFGGGILYYSAMSTSISTSPIWTGCDIRGNVNTSTSGGGIFFDCSNFPLMPFTPTYINCTITGNSSVINGGGIAVCGNAVYTDIAPMFSNCTIASNIAAANGGGIYMDVTGGGGYGGIVGAEYTILWGNCSAGEGNQAFTESGNIVNFDCSDVDSSGIRGNGDAVYGIYRVFSDPAFCQEAVCDPAGTIEGDFTLFTNSPADTLASPCGQLIGAYFSDCTPVTAVEESPEIPTETVLWPAVPNPFNPATSIRFDVVREGLVSLRVYDVSGRIVRTLIDGILSPDRYTAVWDGTDDRGRPVATGVYFDRLRTGNDVRTRKLILIK
jgi:hypothetical protein